MPEGGDVSRYRNTLGWVLPESAKMAIELADPQAFTLSPETAEAIRLATARLTPSAATKETP